VFSRISIRTRLSPEQALDVVRGLIRPEGFLGGLDYAPNDSRPFIGRSKGNQFKVRRRTTGSYSLRPVVVGSVRPIPEGAVVDVVLRPEVVAAMIGPVFFALFGMQAVKEAHQYVQSSGAEGGYGFLIFFAVLFGLAVVSYRFELRKAEQILREAFVAKTGPVENRP
jgi:hypothetical protein